MKNLIVDQCQLESTPCIALKSNVFKTDHGATDVMDGSPEGSDSECSDSITKNPTVLSDAQHGSSLPSSEQSRPSSEVEVEVVSAPPEESASALRTSRPSSGRHHHRSVKRKYEELTSGPSTTEVAMVGLDNNQQHSAENSNSNESASIQDQHHSDTMTDHQTEADVVRWKRLYAGAMDNDSLQVRS